MVSILSSVRQIFNSHRIREKATLDVERPEGQRRRTLGLRRRVVIPDGVCRLLEPEFVIERQCRASSMAKPLSYSRDDTEWIR